MTRHQCKKPKAKMAAMFGTRILETEVCVECIPQHIKNLTPKIGEPFKLALEMPTGETLLIRGEWEGNPTYLTAKQIGGIMSYLNLVSYED